ncbi:MAG TPA: FAD-dependent oxidoreductase [Planctomicrobium sp.]|nr:FAD-dependent oxidoreductase [Planctomicrobium sp.]
MAESSPSSQEKVYDVVVYGGTSAGIMAAVQAQRMGKTVIVLEPGDRIGGLTTGGLGATDIGNKAAIGGLAREFYREIATYYSNPDNWKWQQQPDRLKSQGNSPEKTEDAMWTFEPSVALTVLQSFVKKHPFPVVYQARLDRTPVSPGRPEVRGVLKDGAKITAVRLENGETYRGKVFIDATYEGDLLAGAGVSYTYGREANATYNETLSGVQTKNAKYHIFVPKVDPYVSPGKPESGLLPGIDPNGPGEEGAGDHRLQAYCFRMCLTDHPENRIPFAKPDDYNEANYELLLRNYEAGEKGFPWINSRMPNRKTDTNNRLGFSTDFIGQNYDYPEASYAEREKIIQRHLDYQKGLMWTLAYHPRMAEHIRKEVSRWGMSRDEFQEGDGWQAQLYIREARRMVSDYVMTQHNCQGKVVAERPVGLGAYTMDSHHVQRYVTADGYVQNEGDVQVGGFSPYPIDYGAIVPKQKECENLLVPVCLSSSHMAFGSIRMEPVFMVLGESAATAAAMAIDLNVPVQQIPYAELATTLTQNHQVLQWNKK